MTSVNITPQSQGTSSIIRWETAAKVAKNLAPAGPKVKPADMRAAVESMRYATVASVDYVYEITGLEAAHNLRDSEVLIVDRATWAKANTQSFAVMLDPVGDSLMGQKFAEMTDSQKNLASVAGSTELGGVLAYLSTRVLGQYDPYAALAGHGAEGGRLMIVAPNLIQLEQELNVDPEDFRLWVCLHEQTHRVQFAAAPWMREHILHLMQAMTEELGATSENLMERALSAASSLKNSKESDSSQKTSGVETVMSAEARELLSQITAVMSLLEGHANVVMDAVDSSIVPTVRTIRRRFNRRSETQKILTKFMSKLLGMDRKLRQYKDGQKFVQFIVDARGMQQFNRIWDGAQNLPTETEIHNPQAWIDRVLGAEIESARGGQK
ncbi:zinc-dependent metalloprotease [Rothia amarae]|uniref:Zinc-dependent metalloprotease n=1 Tax=Rothia amarae TaxID=169480 RepID=A0A7H2BKE7_9MICC|nr:zinc-dependent metalloprotease [Rothia amarae]QNV40143.1 zinc-dependent metalloprotease [Rothia amarae]